MFFGSWNIRGLVNPLRQAEIRTFIRSNHLSCIGIVETKCKAAFSGNISRSLCPGWSWLTNYNSSPLGRIWLGWNPAEVDITLLFSSDQMIHVQLRILNLNKTCLCSVVYGEHTFVKRRLLWADIVRLSSSNLP